MARGPAAAALDGASMMSRDLSAMKLQLFNAIAASARPDGTPACKLWALYRKGLRLFLLNDLAKAELDALVLYTVGSEHVHLHNALVYGLLESVLQGDGRAKDGVAGPVICSSQVENDVDVGLGDEEIDTHSCTAGMLPAVVDHRESSAVKNGYEFGEAVHGDIEEGEEDDVACIEERERGVALHELFIAGFGIQSAACDVWWKESGDACGGRASREPGLQKASESSSLTDKVKDGGEGGSGMEEADICEGQIGVETVSDRRSDDPSAPKDTLSTAAPCSNGPCGRSEDVDKVFGDVPPPVMPTVLFAHYVLRMAGRAGAPRLVASKEAAMCLEDAAKEFVKHLFYRCKSAAELRSWHSPGASSCNVQLGHSPPTPSASGDLPQTEEKPAEPASLTYAAETVMDVDDDVENSESLVVPPSDGVHKQTVIDTSLLLRALKLPGKDSGDPIGVQWPVPQALEGVYVCWNVVD